MIHNTSLPPVSRSAQSPFLWLAAGVFCTATLPLSAQSAPAADEKEPKEEIIELSPFTVDASSDKGYRATSTLAGTRIRTDLADVGSSISVITQEMLTDLGATNNETLLAYTINTEVGGPRGNFSGGIRSGTYQEQDLFENPNGNTRVRGLTSADNTRNFFLSDVPWDGYNVARVDIQRGPNAILFGLGSPAGVVNATTSDANFSNKGSAGFSYDSNDSRRFTFDYNRALIAKELGFRISLLRNNQKFQQRPAFSNDTRAFGSLKFSPRFLNANGNTFSATANYEHGRISSNRPRSLTPGDFFTGFWEPFSKGGVNKQTFNFLLKNAPENSSVGGGGISGDATNFINSLDGNDWVYSGVEAYRAIRPDGTVIETRNGNEFGPWPRANSYGEYGIDYFPSWAGKTGKPFANFGAYVGRTMTDPSVFDFYHKLLDGPNKREWTDWNVANAGVSQTFLGGDLGYDLSYFRQQLNRGQWGALGWGGAIFMDINEVNSDTSPNKDIGRAYVPVENRDGGNGITSSDREAYRVQLFAAHDFAKKSDNLLATLFGRHTLTALLSQEKQRTDDRNMRSSDLDPAGLALFTQNPYIEGEDAISTGFKYYISGDLRGRSAAAGSNLGNLEMPFFPQRDGTITIRRFDNTWTASQSVSPAAPWSNPFDPAGVYTQSNNPANYRGWTNVTANYVTINSDRVINGLSAKDYLTSDATLSDFNVKSKTLVWQGYFWKKAIVGTYGYRRDDARAYLYRTSARSGNATNGTFGSANLSPGSYNFSNPNAARTELRTTTRNWSVVTHLNRLMGSRDILPVNVSLYYNQGENFQPLASRIDAFAQPLPAPQGATKEKSILLATKDGKYSLRVTRYDTSVLNGNTTGDIGNMWALEQTLGFTANLARDFRAGRSTTQNYTNAGGDANKLMNQIFPAWFQFEKDLKAKFPAFVNAWMGSGTAFATEGNGPAGAAAPAGFSFTEDSKSKGYEIEFTANPTDNWRVAINGSKTEASRQNVPGAAFKQVAAYVENAMQNTDVGLAPVWWDGNVFGGRNVGPWTIFRPGYLANRALNGQSAGEVRKWRFNVITNYSFTEGRLKGFGIGGGYRWEDRAIVAYAPRKTASGDNDVNLNAPFYAPRETNLDLWLSYERKLSESVNWRIQLNVFSVGQKNSLVPFSASVDYERLPATIDANSKIPMKASAFYIKEGMSWQLSNTLEF
ncbi:TonB-dependent receptor plug domain-containing protein [Nibricoccus sp. IMCC34717]|uniref:TonB-dependent receptor plug domain-containing protein n=1 Tax=Nibricoccus sp. IMCC34717 TaxID=3034021 RepID=UPI00384D0AF9